MVSARAARETVTVSFAPTEMLSPLGGIGDQ